MNGEEGLARLRETLGAMDLRIELSWAFSVRGTESCAFFETKNPATGRWKRVDLPAILPAEGSGRAGLLRMLADMIEAQELTKEASDE